jgi:phosphate transport system protein
MKMGVLVDEAFGKALEALQEQDVELAKQVVDQDRVINRMEVEIEDLCISLIAREQPVAGDLRHVITGMKIVTQLERMGDHAVHIAKTVKKLGPDSLKISMEKLPRMGDLCAKMNRDVLTAFVNDDPQKAREVARMDEEIDELHHVVQRKLLRSMEKSEEFLMQAMHLIYVSHYIERYADHITNISEWIIYGTTGEHVDLNR